MALEKDVVAAEAVDMMKVVEEGERWRKLETRSMLNIAEGVSFKSIPDVNSEMI